MKKNENRSKFKRIIIFTINILFDPKNLSILLFLLLEIYLCYKSISDASKAEFKKKNSKRKMKISIKKDYVKT